MLLEARQRQVLVRRRVLFDLAAIKLPEHPDEDVPRAALLERLLEHGHQVIGLGVAPQIVEPPLGLVHYRAVVTREVEFEIPGETGTGQVGRPGDDAFRPAIAPLRRGHDIGLGVQEGLFVAPDFHVAGAQGVDQLAERIPARLGKGKAVPFPAKRGVHAAESRTHAPPLESLRRFAQPLALVRRPCGQIGAQQQPNRGDGPKVVSDTGETGGAEERGGDTDQIGGSGIFPCPVGGGSQHDPERPRQSIAVPVVDEIRAIRHAAASRTKRAPSRRSISNGVRHSIPKPAQTSGILIRLLEFDPSSCVTMPYPSSSA